MALTTRQQNLLTRVVEVLERESVNTLTPYQIGLELSIPRHAVEEILRLGEKEGAVRKLDETVFYTPRQLADLHQRLVSFAQGRPFALSDLRDAFDTTRKYITPLIAYFDALEITSGPANEKQVRPI